MWERLSLTLRLGGGELQMRWLLRLHAFRFTQQRRKDTSPFIRALGRVSMGRQIGVIALGVVIAVGVIYALFDERISFTGPSYRAPATQDVQK